MTRKKGILGLVILIAIVAGVFFVLNGGSSAIDARSMVAYRGDIRQTVQIAGKVVSDDIQEIRIPSGTKVLEVFAKEGDFVRKGDLIALLDPSDFETNLAKTRISLEQVEADLSTAGGSVDRQILQNNLNKANENLEMARRDYEIARLNLEDMKILLENGAISRAEFENQENLLKSLESSVNTSILNAEDARLRYSDFGSSTSATRESLERQRRSLLLDIEQLQRQIEDARIVADMDGKIVSSALIAERTIGFETSLVIQDMSRFLFEAFVPQEDAVVIERGQVGDVTVTGLLKAYKGKVSDIGSRAELDPASGSSTPKVKITLVIDNPDERLVSGYDSDAQITLGTAENVILVKNEALRQDSEGMFVFRVNNSKAEKTYVTTGITDRFLTEIQEGLDEGDRVVLNPPEEIQDGSDINVMD